MRDALNWAVISGRDRGVAQAAKKGRSADGFSSVGATFQSFVLIGASYLICSKRSLPPPDRWADYSGIRIKTKHALWFEKTPHAPTE